MRSAMALSRLSIILLFLAVLTGCTENPKSTAASGTSAGDSASIPQKITIGGIPQAVLIRGVDTANPVLLILHGGPGFTEMALFSTYNKELEKHFIVVNWDQRGTHLSYSPNIPDSTMRVQQFVDDAHELVTWLKKKYHKEKVYVLGHSWGTMLGVNLVQQFPQDFHAYIGTCQAVSMTDNERLAFKFTLDTAIAENNAEAIKELKEIEPRYPPNGKLQIPDLLLQRKWLNYYGGAIYGKRNADHIYSRVAMEAPLYDSALDVEGQMFSLKTMSEELQDINFMKTATKLEVPVYLLTGRHDYNTPFQLAEEYFNALQAPYKEIIWFENSAHFIPFEETEKFNDVLINKIKLKD